MFAQDNKWLKNLHLIFAAVGEVWGDAMWLSSWIPYVTENRRCSLHFVSPILTRLLWAGPVHSSFHGLCWFRFIILTLHNLHKRTCTHWNKKRLANLSINGPRTLLIRQIFVSNLVRFWSPPTSDSLASKCFTALTRAGALKWSFNFQWT